MNKNVFSILLLTIYLFLYSPSIMPQDTFSIVAVDTSCASTASDGSVMSTEWMRTDFLARLSSPASAETDLKVVTTPLGGVLS